MEKNNELRGSIPYDHDRLKKLAAEFIETANQMGATATYSFTHDNIDSVCSGMMASLIELGELLEGVLMHLPKDSAKFIPSTLYKALTEEEEDEEEEDND